MLERIRKVLTYVGKRLGASDRLLLTLPELEEIEKALLNASNQLAAFTEDGDSARLTAANHYSNDALLKASSLPTTASPEELIKLMDISGSYQANLLSRAREWEESRDKARSEISELQLTLVHLKDDVEQQKDNHSSALSHAKNLFFGISRG